jgi:hypothetical protein
MPLEVAQVASYGKVTFVTCGYRLAEVYFSGKPVWHVEVLGGHRRIGPPSEAGTCWTEAAINVPTSPVIRIAILIARFMGFLL